MIKMSTQENDSELVVGHIWPDRKYPSLKDTEFPMSPGDIDTITKYPDWYEPKYDSHWIRLESALLNAYRSLEATIGDPPKNGRRLRAKIKQIGVDPDELAGYSRKTPIYQMSESSTALETKAQGMKAPRTETFLQRM